MRSLPKTQHFQANIHVSGDSDGTNALPGVRAEERVVRSWFGGLDAREGEFDVIAILLGGSPRAAYAIIFAPEHDN